MIQQKLKKNAKKIDKFLLNYLNKQDQSILISPMKYGVISGGKKLDQQLFLMPENYLRLDKNISLEYVLLLSVFTLLINS